MSRDQIDPAYVWGVEEELAHTIERLEASELRASSTSRQLEQAQKQVQKLEGWIEYLETQLASHQEPFRPPSFPASSRNRQRSHSDPVSPTAAITPLQDTHDRHGRHGAADLRRVVQVQLDMAEHLRVLEHQRARDMQHVTDTVRQEIRDEFQMGLKSVADLIKSIKDDAEQGGARLSERERALEAVLEKYDEALRLS